MKYVFFLLIALFLGLLAALYFLIKSNTVFTGNVTVFDTYIETSIDMMNMIAGMFAITIIAGSSQRYNKSTFGKILLYFIFGTITLTVGRLFLLLDAVKVFTLHEELTDVIWHFTFYFAIIPFIFGIVKLYQLTNGSLVEVSTKTAYILGITLNILATGVILTAPLLSARYGALVEASPFIAFGGQHFLSFIMAGVSCYFLWMIKQKKPIFKTIISSFLWAFVFLALVHFWELLTETFHLIPGDEHVLSNIRELLSLPTFIFISRAFMQDLSLLESTTTAKKYKENKPEKPIVYTQ